MRASTVAPLTVLVAADQPLVGESVRRALLARRIESWAGAWPGGTSADPVDTADQPAPPADAALLMCDLEDPDRLIAARRLVVDLDRVPVLVLTSSPRGPSWGAVLELGVSGVLATTAPAEEIARVLREISAGRTLITPRARRRLITSWQAASSPRGDLVASLESLSPRESSVLRLLDAGMRVPEIAEELAVSEETVRSHAGAIRRKLGVHSLVGAVGAVEWLRRVLARATTRRRPGGPQHHRTRP